MKRLYLDYAATTPVDPRVLEAMLPYFAFSFGNPSSIHSYGREADVALSNSRKRIADAIGARESEIFFTSSATESNNTAIKGVCLAGKAKGRHIVISSVEHDCVLESAKWLESQGFEVTEVPVDKYGMVSPKHVEDAIRKDTLLVSVMHANNEIGTVNPIGEIGKVCREKNVLFHTDASQSLGKLPIDVRKMNVDMLTASSHKMYGPKGAGLLFVRQGVRFEPLLHGGGHERGMRSSTVNIPAVVGFARAVELCIDEMDSEKKRQELIRDRLIKGIMERIPNSHLNGHPEKRLPNNANIRFDFVEGESVLALLDSKGIAVSTASACSSPKLEPSRVLMACGLKAHEAHGTIRMSIGRFTNESEVDFVVKALAEVVEKLREISPFKAGENVQ